VARKTIAEVLNCKSEEVVFTAGGTESINLALFGIARFRSRPPRHDALLVPPLPESSSGQALDQGREREQSPHIITTKVEHHAVLNCCEQLEKEGFRVTYLNVDEEGFVDLDELRNAICDETILVSVMYANNEIGTVEPISKIGSILNKINKDRTPKNLPKIYFHTDACQASGTLPMDVNKLGVDLLSANGSKIYGPKQVGFLYVRSGVKLKPIIYGGGQERNLRSGTENVAGVVGLAEALRLADIDKDKENKRLIGLRDYFLKEIFEKIPKVVLNGPLVQNNSSQPPLKARGGEDTDAFSPPLNLRGDWGELLRLPNNINVSILDVEGEALLLYLDSYNIAVSTGSACTSQSLDPSHVILAIGKPYEYAHGSIRMTLGKSTTKKEIDYVMKVLPGIVAELRRISPVNLDMDKPKDISMEKAFVGENMKKFKKK
jgi:cysteine desulfurase